MKPVRVTCPECGDIELTISDLRARVCIETDHAEYRFRCESCERVTIKDAPSETLDLLVSAGIQVDRWHLPADLKVRHRGPTIDHDDLIAFHDFIEDDAALAKAVSALPAAT